MKAAGNWSICATEIQSTIENKPVFNFSFSGKVCTAISYRNESQSVSGALWLRGSASILLLEGHWYNSPGLYDKVSLGKILNPTLLIMCWSAPCMAATTISVWMYVCGLFGQKHLLNVFK